MDEDFYSLECKHIFHSGCLEEYFNIEINERKFPIKCPEDGCKIDIIIEDLCNILKPNMIENFYDYTLNVYINNNQ